MSHRSRQSRQHSSDSHRKSYRERRNAIVQQRRAWEQAQGALPTCEIPANDDGEGALPAAAVPEGELLGPAVPVGAISTEDGRNGEIVLPYDPVRDVACQICGVPYGPVYVNGLPRTVHSYEIKLDGKDRSWVLDAFSREHDGNERRWMRQWGRAEHPNEWGDPIGRERDLDEELDEEAEQSAGSNALAVLICGIQSIWDDIDSFDS